MDCPSCGRSNRADSKFCMGCGTALECRCWKCGRSLPADATFCDACGQEQGSGATRPKSIPNPQPLTPNSYTPRHLVDKVLKHRSALEGERKQVTVLFADVKESMALADQVNPEEWHRILDRFFTILSDGVHRYEGTINQYTGDGVMALFGAPVAHEDHAQRACHAALLLAEELRSYANVLRLERGLSFSVRMGLNSGEVIVGKIGDDLRMDYTAQGQTVHLAARMEQVAEAGRIYLTENTVRLVGGLFKTKDLGRMQIKGVSDPLHVFELEAIGALRTRLDVARERGFCPFVGRRSEMAALEAALERAAAGHGQVVGVVGEAGVGKSRLCTEFLDRCHERLVTVHTAHCPPHAQRIAYASLLELLRSVFAIRPADSDQAAREKIAGRLLLLDGSFEPSLPLLFEFLGVPDPNRPAPWDDDEARRWRLLGFVRKLVQAASSEPTVYVFDDAHWLDAASSEFVAQWVDAISGAPALLLLNFRPEYQAEWMAKSFYQQLPLQPLDSESIDELLEDLLGSDASIANLPPLIRARAEGNPFFAEEMVHGLVLSGTLVGERGSRRLAKPLDQVELPATVQAVLAARIDRLPEVEKRILQTAAVIGKTFPRLAVERVAGLTEAETRSALSRLVSAELLHDVPGGEPDADYAFKHPLTQEVAYHSQLLDHRKFTHSKVASVLEELHADRLGQQASLIAYHWEAAEQPYVAARWRRLAALKVTKIQVRKKLRG